MPFPTWRKSCRSFVSRKTFQGNNNLNNQIGNHKEMAHMHSKNRFRNLHKLTGIKFVREFSRHTTITRSVKEPEEHKQSVISPSRALEAMLWRTSVLQLLPQYNKKVANNQLNKIKSQFNKLKNQSKRTKSLNKFPSSQKLKPKSICNQV